MTWADASQQLAELYQTVSVWCFNHQLVVDIVIPVTVIGICISLLKEKRRARRRAHRYLWGMLMKRQDREKYQNMRFEDALSDAAMEMHFEGMMNDQEEQRAMLMFAERLGLQGLKPKKNVKQGIKTRLKKKFGLKPIAIPGGKPAVKVDKTYDPHKPDPEGLIGSKYVKD